VNPRAIVGALSLVLAAGLFVAGCSSLPTTPSGQDPATASADSLPATGPAFDTRAVSISRSVYVRAPLGGTVVAGNFRVVVPPGALPDDAIVTVRQPDLSKPVVELSVTPGDRNAFLLPVLLVADVTPMDGAKVPASYISRWNPVAGQWERCAQSSVDPANLRVQAPLSHFSTYRVETDGKAGW
jgi:hypothetical protein